jgi:hypothetical protein
MSHRAIVLRSALALLLGLCAVPSAQTTRVPMGINVNNNQQGEPPVWLNMMLQGREWEGKNLQTFDYSSGCPLDSFELDADGYPLEIPQTVTGFSEPQGLMCWLPANYPPGRYVLLYDGDGDFFLYHAQNVQKQAGRWTFDYPGGGTDFELDILRSTRGNHIHNVRIIPVAAEGTDYVNHPFLPSYLNVMSKFHCLRFMGWQGTNCSTQKNWNKRRLPTSYTQATSASYGPAIEYAAIMCNEANADMWFCVPHQADDQYLDSCAALIKRTLSPPHKLYLEYSNECWNWGPAFCQFRWINGDAGDANACLGAADSIVSAIRQIWANDGSHFEAYGWLADRTFKHFRAVWTGADRQRLVRVCASQCLDARALTKVMSMGGCDAFACAPYFGMSNEANTRFCNAATGSVTTKMILDSISAQVTGDTSYLHMASDIARNAGVPLIYYEGGADFGYDGCTYQGAYSDSVKAACRLPGMYDVCVKAIRESLTPQVNCQLYVPLNCFGAPEHYGHIDSSGQLAAYPFAQLPPKWRALMDCNTDKGTSGVAPTLASAARATPRIAPRTVLGLGNLGVALRHVAGTDAVTLYDMRGRRVQALGPTVAQHAVYIVDELKR